jgi:hypothetical protein
MITYQSDNVVDVLIRDVPDKIMKDFDAVADKEDRSRQQHLMFLIKREAKKVKK